MTHTIRKPIGHLSELAPGDTLVRRRNDERFTVDHVSRAHVIVTHPTAGTERVIRADVLGSNYEVERPEVLPAGLERREAGRYGFTYTDWAGDTGYLGLSVAAGAGPVVTISGNASSVHIATDVLRFLADAADENARPSAQ